MKACHLLQGNSNSDAMGTTHFFHSKNEDSYGRAHWCPNFEPYRAAYLLLVPMVPGVLKVFSVVHQSVEKAAKKTMETVRPGIELHRSCRTASSVTREVEIKGLIWNGTFGHGFCGSFKAKFQELSQNREALFAFGLNLRGGPFILRLLPIWS
jgi:hypothetical protein